MTTYVDIVRKSPRKLPTTIAYSTSQADNTMNDNVEVILDKKVEKEMEIKKKDKDTSEFEFNDTLTQMIDDKFIRMIERREAINKA